MLRFDTFGDGYTERGYIAAKSGLNGAVRFSFRPALVEESRRLCAFAREVTATEYDREAAKFTADKIAEWDLSDRRMAITPAAILRLPNELFMRLHEIVAGWDGSDIDPDWPAENRERALEINRAAEGLGRSVGELREERDELILAAGVNLILFHPRVLDRSCQSCRAWMYDEIHQLIRRLGEPVPRPASSPTPCWTCAKRSPTHAADIERDLGRIQATLQLFLQVRATQGVCLTDRQKGDRLLARHLALVDLIVRRWEAGQGRPHTSRSTPANELRPLPVFAAASRR